MISRDVIADIKYRNDIEDVIATYVTLKRAGSNLNGLCPFHSEKTPSFTVFPSSKNFYCFGCGAGGDVVTFIMKAENLDYVSAIKFLGKRVGITVEDTDEVMGGVSRTRLYDINKAAAKYFHSCLLSPKGEPGLDYLMNKRKFSRQTINHFGLGYAPDEWDGLTIHLRGLGYTDEEMKTAFLAGISQKNGKAYDYFRGKVMIPIIDLAGNIIAFGGRVLGNEKPKYINTSDTPIFKKSRNLFALNFAKNVCQERMILCEGYMDVISLHQAGFTEAVATLGTAITPEHARLMKKHTAKAIISYDSDAAGQKAADKAFLLLSEVGLESRVLSVTDGAKDPDDYIRLYGAHKFEQLLEGTKTKFEFKFEDILKRNDITETNGKVKAANETVELIATFPSLVERTVYAGKAAEKLGIPANVLLEDSNKKYKKEDRKKNRDNKEKMMTRSGGYGDTVNPDYVKNPAAAAAEEAIIGIIMISPELIKKLKELDDFSPDWFLTEFGKRVYTAILEVYDPALEFDESMIFEGFTPAEVGRITKMKIRRLELKDNTWQVLLECVNKLKSAVRKKSENDIESLEELIKNKRSKK